MATVGSYEAKTHLPRLLKRVAAGERITITHRGVPVAVLVPFGPPEENAGMAVQDMGAFIERRRNATATQAEIREWREEGRR